MELWIYYQEMILWDWEKSEFQKTSIFKWDCFVPVRFQHNLFQVICTQRTLKGTQVIVCFMNVRYDISDIKLATWFLPIAVLCGAIFIISILLMFIAWRLHCGHACAFVHVDEAVSGGKPHAGRGVVGLLSWIALLSIYTFSKVRHGDTRSEHTSNPHIWPAS